MEITTHARMDSPRQVLKQYFGYDQFRGLQEQAIQAALQKRDALVLMPTGGGKSICFQVPALLQEGFAVVISPLIALMKDQVDALVSNGISAGALHSANDSLSDQQVYQDIANGKLKLLYLSPEKAVSMDLTWWSQQKVNLLAIDEAHCVSAWGHDFRPEYTQLTPLRAALKGVPAMALTATADKTTRKDITAQLGLKDPEVFVDSFNRSNLWLEVAVGVKPTARKQQILEYLMRHPDDAGIIYCLSRKSTEEVAGYLQNGGVRAAAYHAGLAPEQRNAVQNEFLNDQLQVICATIAFGMGIDKSNVRFVMHYNLPKNMEGYYQEIGRAGRDGLPAFTRLYYHYSDLMMLTKFAQESAFPEKGISKLEQIQAYSEAQICRRIILLNYFSEHLPEPCGHCDVCKTPPDQMDGTRYAQMALSAIVRMEESGRMTQVIQVLRGNNVAEIRDKGWDKLKTFGVGHQVSQWLWSRYLMQMQQLGLIETAYDQGFALKATPLGWEVLKGQQAVQFFVPKMADKKEETAAEKTSKPRERNQTLRTQLKQKRMELAKAQGVPPYVIFNDKTLEDLLDKLPITHDDWLGVQGISEYRAEQVAPHLTPIIDAYLTANKPLPVPKGKTTYDVTWALYESGLNLEEIAEKRKLSRGTIVQHFCKCLEMGLPVPVEDFVGQDIIQSVQKALEDLHQKGPLKPIFDYLLEQVPYEQIRFAVTYLEVTGAIAHIPEAPKQTGEGEK
jgi:ATP-dependent DNA helicase RecQ